MLFSHHGWGKSHLLPITQTQSNEAETLVIKHLPLVQGKVVGHTVNLRLELINSIASVNGLGKCN